MEIKSKYKPKKKRKKKRKERMIENAECQLFVKIKIISIYIKKLLAEVTSSNVPVPFSYVSLCFISRTASISSSGS